MILAYEQHGTKHTICIWHYDSCKMNMIYDIWTQYMIWLNELLTYQIHDRYDCSQKHDDKVYISWLYENIVSFLVSSEGHVYNMTWHAMMFLLIYEYHVSFIWGLEKLHDRK